LGVPAVFYSVKRENTIRRNKGLNKRRPLWKAPERALAFLQVTSASAKPRFAGRQPSIRGGVPRVTTRPVRNGCGKRGFPYGDPS
jgi:hypothetical protein